MTRDDLLMSLRDSPPTSRWKQIQHPVMLIAFALACIFFALNDFVPGFEPIPAVVWPLVACVLFPGWVLVVRLFSPSHQKRVRRIDVLAEHQKRIYGWIADDQLVIYDDTSAIVARWTFYGPAFLFPTHLMIPLGVDANLRVVLPYRFFASAADAALACRFIRGRLGGVVNKSPGDRQLAEVDFEPQVHGPVSLEETRQWNSERWPFEAGGGQSHAWAIDLTGNHNTVGFACKTAVVVLLMMTWYFVPMWLVVAAWLIADSQFFGHWGFLVDRPGATAIVLGPAALMVLIFIYAAGRAGAQLIRLRSQPMEIHLRETGVHLSHATFVNWFPWSSVERVIATEKATGWVVKESGDEVLYMPANFDSLADYERFRAKLRELGPSE